MKPIHRSLIVLLVLLFMAGNFAAGVSADATTKNAPPLGTVIDPETGIEHEILSSVEDIIPEEFTDDEIAAGVISCARRWLP